MFWNKQNGANNQNSDQKTGKKNWLHTPDVLVNGHVAYPVKFLGSTPVDQPKGIEVVKEAIRRLQFSQQLKKAEGGNNVKTKKVEITVSINGVAIQRQENKVQVILHQFPLHKISYCADEKGSKKFFSFIAKAGGGSNNSNLNNSNGASPDNTSESEVHECFVFISNKLASDITLTIGQAFDLAYRRYISESSKSGGDNTDLTKLQLQNKHLENSLVLYQQRLKELSEIVPKFELEKILAKLCLKDICDLPQENGFEYESNISSLNSNSKSSDSGVGLDIMSNTTNNNDSDLLIETSPKNFVPLIPPRNFQNQLNNTLDALRPSVGTKLEGLLLNSDSDSDFDPRASESDKVPEPNTNHNSSDSNNINDLFGFEPPKTVGQQLFTIQNGNLNSFNNSNGSSNGNSIVNNGMPSSPPPLLAPPPKAAIPRRTITPNKQPNSQDLFGSTPFSPFDETPINNFGSTDFAIDVSDSSDNPFKPISTKPMNKNTGSIANTTINNSSTPNFVLNDLSSFANNLDKLDTILIKTNYDNDEMTTMNGNMQQTTTSSNLNGIKKLNPFHKANSRSKSPSLNEMMIEKEPNVSGPSNTLPAAANNNNSSNNNINSGSGQPSILSSPKKVNPFSRTDSFLNRNLKYDSFKNAIDSFETTMYSSNNNNNQNTNNPNKFGGGGLLANNNNNNSNNDDKLNFYSASLNFNEFSNRLIDSDLNHKNNFTTTTTNNNNGLNFGTAFTLESLDPLRK